MTAPWEPTRWCSHCEQPTRPAADPDGGYYCPWCYSSIEQDWELPPEWKLSYSTWRHGSA